MLQNITNDYEKICLMNNEIDIISFNNFSFLFFFYFIKLFFLFISGTGIAIIFVSYFLYQPSKIKFDKSYNENKEIYEYNPFLISCLDEYYKLDEDKDDDYLKTLVNKYLYYTFDFRDKKYKIVMNFNFENGSFDYYLDNKSHILPFEFLDTISRIYCVNYNCRNIYIDNLDNKEKLLDSYNSDSSDNLTSPGRRQQQEEHKEQVKNTIFYNKTKNSIKPKNKIIDYTSNKFKYKGLLKEFSDLIINLDIYNSENKLVSSYEDLKNEKFSVKKNDDFEVVNENENENNISFKFFKQNQSILS